MSIPIALVLNPDFGDRVAPLARQMPVWILSSPVNDRSAQVACLALDPGRITTLRRLTGEDAADTLARALYAIDEHHGESSPQAPYDTLWIYGTSVGVPESLASELGFTTITTIRDGLKAMK